MNVREKGIDNIRKTLEHFLKQYSVSRITFLESNGYKEAILSTAYVKVLQKSGRDVILWGINNSIYKQFTTFSLNANCIVFNLPDNPSVQDRAEWYNYVSSKKIPIFSSVNGPIKAGNVRPFFPITDEDVKWFNDFSKNNNITKPIILTNYKCPKNNKYCYLGYNAGPEDVIDVTGLSATQLMACVSKASYVLVKGESLIEYLAVCEGSIATVLRNHTDEQIVQAVQ